MFHFNSLGDIYFIQLRSNFCKLWHLLAEMKTTCRVTDKHNKKKIVDKAYSFFLD